MFGKRVRVRAYVGGEGGLADRVVTGKSLRCKEFQQVILPFIIDISKWIK